MAKRAKEESSGGDSARRGNGFDPEAVKSFASRVENLEGEIEVFRQEFKDLCDPIKEDIKIVIEQAEAAGVPKKEFKKVLKRRAIERKIEADREKLSGFEKDNYDNLRLALGDFAETGLGAAAMGRTGHRPDAHA